jgi:hypothetical protein
MKKAATILVTMIFLVSCGQVQTTPAAEPTLVVSTVTSAPTDISIPSMTPTSTLEPWMQSLPENVVSVEVKDGQIMGLGSQGNELMVYSLDTGEWESLSEPVEIVQDRSIELISSVEFENIKLEDGLIVSGLFGIDQTLSAKGASKIEVPKKLAGDLLLEVAFINYWYHGDTHRTAIPTDADRKQYREALAQVQEGGERDASELAVNLCDYVAPAIGTEAGQECRRVVFFPGNAELDANEAAVMSVKIAYVNGIGKVNYGEGVEIREDMPNYSVVAVGGYGFEEEYDEITGELLVKLGVSYKASKDNLQAQLTTVTAGMFTSLKLNDGISRVDFKMGNSYYEEGQDYVGQGFSVK